MACGLQEVSMNPNEWNVMKHKSDSKHKKDHDEKKVSQPQKRSAPTPPSKRPNENLTVEEAMILGR